eukprot:470896-Rhodomonas_salina.4
MREGQASEVLSADLGPVYDSLFASETLTNKLFSFLGWAPSLPPSLPPSGVPLSLCPSVSFCLLRARTHTRSLFLCMASSCSLFFRSFCTDLWGGVRGRMRREIKCISDIPPAVLVLTGAYRV